MEQIKKLPVVDHVPFTAYQTRGFEAGILLGNFENAEELLFQTCINFFFRINGNTLLFDYIGNCGIISVQSIRYIMVMVNIRMIFTGSVPTGLIKGMPIPSRSTAIIWIQDTVGCSLRIRLLC